MLALFPAMNYKPWYAIGEFVDNAIQSWAANKELIRQAFGEARLNIEIEFDQKHETIIITDNAAGIFTGDIHRAFTPASPPADTSGLSQFGIGMKSAASWYAKNFTVTTTALGEAVRRSVRFDIPAIVESNASTIPLVEEPARADDHGTRLTLSNLNHPLPRGRTLWKVRDYLMSIYRSFLIDPDVHIVVGGKELVYKGPDLLVAPRWDSPGSAPVTWRKSLNLQLPSGAAVKGWAGLLAKGKAKQAGFALLYRDKVVKGAGGGANDTEDGYKPYEIFGAPNSFESQRLIGELNVSDIPVTHTKDALLWQGDDEQRLTELLAEQLDTEPLPLLRMARGHRSTERGRSARQHVQNALDSVAKTLEEPMPSTPAGLEPAAASKKIDQDDTLETHETIERAIQPSDSVVDLGGHTFYLRVIDTPSAADRWLLLSQVNSDWQLEINRSHPFMQSFASVPSQDIEPVLRLAIGFALLQIKAERSGTVEPRLIVPSINELVKGPLSRRIP